MMSQEKFHAIYPKNLTPAQHKVLDALLQGETDRAIARSLEVTPATVRKHIPAICKKFGIQNQSGESNKLRDELVQLFVKHKPELVCDELKEKFGANINQSESKSDREGSEFEQCYQILSKPGALLRLTGNRQSGKTILIQQILKQFENDGQRTVYLSLRKVDSSYLYNLDKFLQWLCNEVSRQMQLPSEVADFWDDTTGSKSKCESYFEEYLLTDRDTSLVLCLDDFHRIYQGKIVLDVCDMLRSWYDNRITNPIWTKLRLVLIYPSEVTPPSIVQNSTLFNTGYVINLSDIN